MDFRIGNKILVALVALSSVPLGMARSKASYPAENVAQFVADKLDLNSLPSPFRPKKEKGKKTFADYGFQTQALDGNTAVVTAAGGGKRMAIAVLDHNSSGIYVCLASSEQNGVVGESQSVVLLKWRDGDTLLKGNAAFREFAACPLVGSDDSAASSY